MPETRRHLELRTLLFTLLKTFGASHTVGSEQFVYWSASQSKRCLAPDAFVRLGVPDAPFDSWKTWERGAPELAVEIVSHSDSAEESWEDKLAKYHDLGVRELVRFDPEAAVGARLRAWDRIDDDLVERRVTDDRTACSTLGLWWVVTPVAPYPAGLRLTRDAEGKDLVPTPDEASEARAAAASALARAEAEGRAAAERRVAELEAELARRGG